MRAPFREPPAWLVAVLVGGLLTLVAATSGRYPLHTPGVTGDAPSAPTAPVVKSQPQVGIPAPPSIAADLVRALPATKPERIFRVRLTGAGQGGSVTISADADLLLVDPDTHEPLKRIPAATGFTLSVIEGGAGLQGPNGPIGAEAARFLAMANNAPVRVDNAAYLGTIDVRAVEGRLEVVNLVRQEDYVAGVVSGELMQSFPMAALKAQAVAARTFATYRTRDDAMTVLVDTVDDQVYAGVGAEWPQARQAANSTAGMLAVHNGRPIVAYYSADCGGWTRGASGVGGGERPYLKAVKDGPEDGDDYCASSPSHSWTTRLTTDEVLNAVRTAGIPLQTLEDIRFTGVSARDGRVREVTLVGELTSAPTLPAEPTPPPDEPTGGEPARIITPPVPNDGGPMVLEPPVDIDEEPVAEPKAEETPEPNSMTIPAMDFRRAIGLTTMRSQIMTVAKDEDGWIFTGKGYGHGVGMCQWGAKGMAEAGFSSDAILKHYYTGISIEPLTPPRGTLEGVARTSDGRAVPDALVYVVGTDRVMRTDKTGRFRFQRLPVGDYDIAVLGKKGASGVSFAWTVNPDRSTFARIIVHGGAQKWR